MLREHGDGGYSFLTGIAPYSCGVVAAPGHRLVRVVLAQPLPWRQGLEGALRMLGRDGRPPEALAAVELRSPAVRTMSEFAQFNGAYLDAMCALGVIGDGPNPVARTNVVPDRPLSAETVVHAVTVSMPADVDRPWPSFVVAGAGELVEARLQEAAIVRRGESSSSALEEKARFVLGVMEERIAGLGASWAHVTCASVYTRHQMGRTIDAVVREATGDRFGVTWYGAAPPVADVEFEMDARGGTDEVVADLSA
ncbi:MAG: hypothetical protein KJS90_06435 [Acidobacteria bacterium]|nr:hypothetical protein [Acidobacteriota bacterium]